MAGELRVAVFVLAVLFGVSGAVNLALYGDSVGVLFIAVGSLFAAGALWQSMRE